MATRIGLLLPRSTDYPAMGYDIMDGLKLGLKKMEYGEVDLISENIGFGENASVTYSVAEKLLLQHEADMLVIYSSSVNAEALYPLADALQKTIIILDTGMQLPSCPPSPYCFHISLQGVHACRIAGKMAGEGNRKVLMATSFYDGGYRGPWCYDRGLSEAGGSVCGNYVSGHRIADFTIEPYMSLLQKKEANSVAACFSSYLAELFFKALHEHNGQAVPLPFYCSPFMAEEQLLNTCHFPGGTFFTVVPWAQSLQNDEKEAFASTIFQQRKKAANIFHLLGWEASSIVKQWSQHGITSLKGFTYQSPRGTVSLHADTHYTYAPLYEGRIEGDTNGKCRLRITGTIAVSAASHNEVMADAPAGSVSGWKNNYLCI